MLEFLSNKKKLAYWLAAPVAVLGIFLLVQPANAGIQEAILVMLGWIIMPIVHFLGNVLLLLIEILINVFSYSEIIDSSAVQLGWVIMRDIANIGIVVALIIIAFSTVFRIQKYTASRLLVQLIIAAFLVNFSLLIAGFIIDFGQVIMMTFVNAFRDLAAGNLTVGFGLESMLRVATSVSDNPGFDTSEYMTVIGALLLGVVLLVVAIAVVLVFIIVLLQRVVFLWILAIFSPIAWVAPLLPGGESWSSQWWDNFSKQVFIGPVLAFGFWLSMSILSGVANDYHLIDLEYQSNRVNNNDVSNANVSRFVSEVSSPQGIFDFMVTIALLLGTLWMARQAGGAAGSFASSTSAKLQKGGMAPLRGAGKLAKGSGRLAGRGAALASRKTGATSMAKAMVMRTQTSKLGRKIGLDKQYTKDKNERQDSRSLERYGGARFAGAIKQNEDRQAAKAQEKLSGSSDEKLATNFNKTMAKGGVDNKIEALAGMKELAKRGKLTPGQVQQYVNQYGGGLNNLNDIQQRTAAEHVESLWDTQGKNGDELAKYKSIVGRVGGDLTVRSMDDRMKSVYKDFGKKGLEGMRQLGKPGSLSDDYTNDGEVANPLELQAVLGTLDINKDTGEISETAKRNIGQLNNDQRKVLRDYMTSVLAMKEKHGIEENDSNYLGLMQASMYMHQDNKFNRDGTLKDDKFADTAVDVGTDGSVDRKKEEIRRNLVDQRSDTQKLNIEGGLAGEKLNEMDKVTTRYLQGGVSSRVIDEKLDKIHEVRDRSDDIGDDYGKLKPATLQSVAAVNGIYSQLKAQAATLDMTPGQSTGQFGTKANGTQGELTFQEVLDQSKIGKLKKEMNDLAVRIRVTPEADLDVEKTRKEMQSLLDQTSMQVQTQSHAKTRPSIAARGLVTEPSAKQDDKIKGVRNETKNGMARAGNEIGSLSGLTNGKERTNAIKRARNTVKTLIALNKNINPDKEYINAMTELVKNIDELQSMQKSGRVDARKIAEVNAEIIRLGDRYKTTKG